MELGHFGCANGLIHVLYHDRDLIVRNSNVSDWKFVDKLQKDNSFAVGFVPRTYWEKEVWGGIKNSIVLICEKNADPVGYVYITPGTNMGYAKIQQIVVRNDARRLDYGTALLAVTRQFCETFSRRGVTLRCRIDLESNKFWEALGFYHYGTWAKGRINHSWMKASNDINLWRLDLNGLLIPLFDSPDITVPLFALPPQPAAMPLGG